MADVVSKNRRSEIMRSIRSTDTKPEMIVRKFLFNKGFRYRLHDKSLPGKPDIKITKYKCVVLINGCFWHGHKNCKAYVMPKTNKKFWYNKIQTNVLRDRSNIRKLHKLGWKVIVVWECALKNKSKDKELQRIVDKIYLPNI